MFQNIIYLHLPFLKNIKVLAFNGQKG